MSEKEIIRLAEEISFRLLATKGHDEHQWLIDVLMVEFKKNKPKDNLREIITMAVQLGADKQHEYVNTLETPQRDRLVEWFMENTLKELDNTK
jgi:hypothetical protein